MGLIDSIKNSRLVQTFTPKDIEGTFDDGTGKFYIHYNGLPIGTADITADVNEGVERSATVRITAGLLTKDVNIIQAGKVQPEVTKRWMYGTTPPDSEDEWEQLFLQYGYNTYYLPWKKKYGWFDCNKVNPDNSSSSPVEDGSLCWAATASNMIHWWIAQNKKYIDMYGDKYTGPDYSFPLDKEQTSDIFQLYTDSFFNEGGRSDEGVNWFIRGTIPTYPERRSPENPGGFFKDVFPEGVLLGSVVTGMGKDRFSDTIKDALDNKKAIGASIGPIKDSHVVSVWGAEIGPDGYVSAIYIVENNDIEYFSKYGIGCLRLEIEYPLTPEGATYTAYRTGYGNELRAVNRLSVLSLGEEYWKQYFGIE